MLGIDSYSILQPVPVADDRIPSFRKKNNVVTLLSVDKDEYADEIKRNKKKF